MPKTILKTILILCLTSYLTQAQNESFRGLNSGKDNVYLYHKFHRNGYGDIVMENVLAVKGLNPYLKEKYWAIFPNLPKGQVILVENISNGQSLFIIMQSSKQNSNPNQEAIIQLSPACFEALKLKKDNSPVEVSYYIDGERELLTDLKTADEAEKKVIYEKLLEVYSLKISQYEYSETNYRVYCTKLLELSKKLKNEVYEAIAYVKLGQLQVSKKNYEKAIEYYKKVEDIRIKAKDYKRLGWIYGSLIYVNQKLNNIDEVEKYYDKRIQVYLKIEEIDDAIYEYKNVISWLLKMKRFDDVKKYYDGLMELWKKEESFYTIQYYEKDLLFEYRQKYILNRKEENLIAWYKVCQITENVFAQSWSTDELIRFYKRKRKYQKAIKIAKEKVEKQGQNNTFEYDVVKVCNLYFENQDYEKGIEYYLKILEEEEKYKTHPDFVYAYNNFIGHFVKPNRKKESILNAIKMYFDNKKSSFSPSRQIFANRVLSWINQQQKNYKTSASQLEKVLLGLKNLKIEFINEKEVNMLSDIAFLYQLAKDSTKSLKYFNKTLEIPEIAQNPEKTAIQLNKIAYVYQSFGQFDKADETYLKSWEKVKNLSDKVLIGQFRRIALYFYKKRNKKDSAQKIAKKLLESFDITEEDEKLLESILKG